MAKKSKLGVPSVGVDSFLKDYLEKRKKPSSDKVDSVTNFESRIQDPSKYIVNPDGSTSTHKMFSFEAGGKYYVAPEIAEDENGNLIHRTGRAAVDHALRTKNYKEFATDAEAKAYAADGYKSGTPMESFEYLGRKKTGPSVNSFLKTRNKKKATSSEVSPTSGDLFSKFKETLPDNLKYTNEKEYNLRGYWESLGSPSEFDYSQPKEKDGYYHAFSRNPRTGEILKKENHPTFNMAIDKDIKSGFYPYRNKKTGTVYTFDKEPNPNDYVKYEKPFSYLGLNRSIPSVNAFLKTRNKK